MTSFFWSFFMTSRPDGDLAEHGVNAVQVPGVGFAEHHEELAAAGVLAGVRHGERADGVLVRIAGGLALDLVAGTAGADARIAGGQILRQRIAALDDEVGDHAVEFHAVVEAAVGELLEVGDGVRRFLVEQLGDDGALVGLEGGGL